MAELKELAPLIAGGSQGNGDIATIKGKVNQIMATLQDFQAKIDTINTNTTASAAAAQAIAQQLTDLKNQISNMGLTAEQEAAIFAALDGPISAGQALKTFLEQTASSPTNEPPPVEPPPGPGVTPTEG